MSIVVQMIATLTVLCLNPISKHCCVFRSAPPPPPSSVPRRSKRGSSSHVGVIVGVTLGVVALFVAAALLGLWLRRRRQQHLRAAGAPPLAEPLDPDAADRWAAP